ncbi:MAG: hypothetical protein IIW86_00465 [Clostridia bacterium]|nr:hypothetical protein [Clostridia bacterium]
MTQRIMYSGRQEYLPLPPFKPVIEDVVVSLTSYGERIQHILPTLKTLDGQSKKPTKIVLYIAKHELGLVPDEVANYAEVRGCEDTRSHKKFNGFFDFPEAYVVTADDDLLYSDKWLETLMRASQLSPYAVVAHNTFLLEGWSFGRPTTRRDNSASLKGRINMYVMSGAGVLRPPKMDLSELRYAYNFSPNCDEKPLSALLRLKHIPVLATRLNEKPYNTEAYKLPKGGLWEQFNQKHQDLRWDECHDFIEAIKRMDYDNRFN